jgi:hypothetical protein
MIRAIIIDYEVSYIEKPRFRFAGFAWKKINIFTLETALLIIMYLSIK